ncbi:hypothetical protein [Salinispora arenicola]|uniref:hypothetical protein n=1 Tax=Salinispora arenicola TaxID=168697 RepID=UPI00037C7076|nr:hypothetical protein [Salinispora arenicola]
MPITVRKDIKVTELRKGDTFDETPPAVVESLTRKATWGAVQIAGEATPRRLRLDASVTVLREEPTEDEQARHRRTVMVELLTDELTRWLRYDPARMLREIVDNDRGYGEVLTWSNLPDVLKAQAMFKHARVVWHHLGEPADLAAADEDTLLEAFASWWYINVHQLGGQGPRHDPISRSTSIISNIIDDCDDWAIQEIRSRIGWAGAREEMQRRVTQAPAARR